MAIQFTQEEIDNFLTYVRKIKKIEIFNLEDSIINHPEYVDEAGTFFVKLLSIARVKDKLVKETEALVESEVRKDPSRFNLGEKVTDKATAMAVTLDPRVSKAKQDAIDAQLNSDQAKILYEAIGDKKEMIRYLMYLTTVSHKNNKEEAIIPNSDSAMAEIIKARIKNAQGNKNG